MDFKTKLFSTKIFDSNFVAIHKNKTIVIPRKPAYVGMCILELSKVPMYKFDCDYIKNKYSNKSRLLFPDTDNLVYEIGTEMFMTILVNFDFSNYSAESKYYDYSNTLLVGKMKDEMSGIAFKKLVGLKPKMYLILVSDSSK